MSIEQERQAMELLRQQYDAGGEIAMPRPLYQALEAAYPLWGLRLVETSWQGKEGPELVILRRATAHNWINSIAARLPERVAQQLLGGTR